MVRPRIPLPSFVWCALAGLLPAAVPLYLVWLQRPVSGLWWAVGGILASPLGIMGVAVERSIQASRRRARARAGATVDGDGDVDTLPPDAFDAEVARRAADAGNRFPFVCTSDDGCAGPVTCKALQLCVRRTLLNMHAGRSDRSAELTLRDDGGQVVTLGVPTQRVTLTGSPIPRPLNMPVTADCTDHAGCGSPVRCGALRTCQHRAGLEHL